MSFNFFWTCSCLHESVTRGPTRRCPCLRFCRATAARSGNCCISALLSLGMASISLIISTFTCFNVFILWIAWQVRLPGGELEDALVPCDSAQGVVPLTAIPASWKYWGPLCVFWVWALESGVFYQERLPLPVDLPWIFANALHETHPISDPADLPRYCATNSMRSSHGCRLAVTLQSS